jgi:hypothetical protein
VIHSTGDSHCGMFLGLPGCLVHGIGNITLKRVAFKDDGTLPTAVKTYGLQPGDVLALCLGEIDLRCYVKGQMEAKGQTPREFFPAWVDAYLGRALKLETNGARVAIVSIVPPCTAALVHHVNWPVAGTDEERVIYAATFNELLAQGCAERGLIFIDVWSEYKDEKGMLIYALSDGCTHIQDRGRVAAVLQRMGLL